jgi:hypothetical protein
VYELLAMLLAAARRMQAGRRVYVVIGDRIEVL